MFMRDGELFGLNNMMVAILAIVAVVGVFNVQKINQNTAQVTHKYWPAADAAMEMEIAFLQKGYAHAMILEGEIDEAKKMWDEADEKFKEDLASLRATGLVDEAVIMKVELLNDQLNKTGLALSDTYLSADTDVQALFRGF